jgi:chromate transport protein ChrA
MPLLLQNFWGVTQVSLLSWGGGPTSLALMQSEAVKASFTTRREFGG